MKPSVFLASVTQELPFIIRVADSLRDFAALCAFRSGAYARHDYTASLPARLAQLDEYDRRARLLIALDKCTGHCIGTLRISLSTQGEGPRAPYEPLGIVQGRHHAYVDRFAVHVADNHATVRYALIKAMWLLICSAGVPWIVCSALAPLARLYRGVGLYPLPGAEQGFRHPRLHDSALYYMCGGRSVEFYGNLHRAHPERAHWFGTVHHPDIQLPWPPSPDWIQLAPGPALLRGAGRPRHADGLQARHLNGGALETSSTSGEGAR